MSATIKKQIVEDSTHLAERGAEIIRNMATQSIDQQGHFAMAISGGSTPRAMHKLFAQKPYAAEIPWQKIHLFMVDERMVAFDHPHSNFGTAQKDFLEKVPIPQKQIHPMPCMAHPEKAAADYQAELETFFSNFRIPGPFFDLIILGIGTDGHIASLFPGQPVVENPHHWVLCVKGGQPDILRLTLSYHVLNCARHILILVSGNGKAPIVKSLFESDQVNLPAANIRPSNGVVHWLLDRSAASLLSKNLM